MTNKFKLLFVLAGFSFVLSACGGTNNYENYAKITINNNTNSAAKIINPKDVTLTRSYHSLETDKNYNTQILPSVGDVKLLVIPVTIPGYETPKNISTGEKLDKNKVKEDINKAFFGDEKETGWESVASFYKKSSYGKLNLTGTVTDWFDAKEAGFTSASQITTTTVLDLIDEAIDWVKDVYTEINLSDYDYDKDGFIDGVWFVYSAPDYTHNGPQTDDSNYWAYTFWGNQDKKGDLNNPIYNLFGWASYDFIYEAYGYSSIDAHTFIHETGHFLGLSDLYSDVSTYNPAGKVDMMDANITDHNSYNKMLLGWTKPYLVLGNGEITIPSSDLENACIVIPGDSYKANNNEFDPFGEYIVIEYYSTNGLNKKDSTVKLNSNTPLAPKTNGVKISHVDNRLFYLDKTDSFKYTVVPYSGENQPIDELHRLINPMSNKLSYDSYNKLGLDQKYNNCDEYRVIEASGSDSFTSGAYLTSNSLFKADDTFSVEKYKAFFNIEEGKLNSGDTFSTTLTISELK